MTRGMDSPESSGKLCTSPGEVAVAVGLQDVDHGGHEGTLVHVREVLLVGHARRVRPGRAALELGKRWAWDAGISWTAGRVSRPALLAVGSSRRKTGVGTMHRWPRWYPER